MSLKADWRFREPRDEKFTSPLAWTLDMEPNEDGDEIHSANTPFGSYRVEKYEGRWKWRYCFDEYYDEDENSCDDLAEGKQFAQAHWDDRVQSILANRVALTQA
jgi:hypothetical protein